MYSTMRLDHTYNDVACIDNRRKSYPIGVSRENPMRVKLDFTALNQGKDISYKLNGGTRILTEEQLAERERRIKLYTERASRELPLFD
jgi:hypothetical protein